MEAPQHERRDISDNQFGDNAVLNQNNVHFHLPRPPARAGVARVIPYQPNDDLICRRDLVEKLDKLLPVAPGFYSAALWGLGGSGKTQIALDYAYRRCYDDQCSIFWVHADSEATFTSDYKTIGKELGVDKSLDGPDLLDAVRSSIERQSRWVLILDNADDLGLFGVAPTGGTRGMNESLFKHVPRGPQGTILWTSRDAHITGTLVSSRQGIKITPMTRDEAKDLLARAMGEESVAMEIGIDRLLEELQWLPLAVSQAGAYIRQTSMTISEYLHELSQGASRWELLKMNDYDRHRRPDVSNSVLETWRISITRIREESELSYRVLHVIAYLDSREIPHELMVAAGQYRAGEEHEDKQATDLDLRHAFTRLVNFSFLTTRRAEDGGRSYEMHKLVQEAVRYGLWVQGRRDSALGKAITHESKLGTEEAYYSSIALHIVDDIFPEPTRDSRALCERHMAHAIQVAEWAEMNGKEVETSALLIKVSGFLSDQGRWREMEPLARRTLNILLEALGEKHPYTIESMAILSMICIKQGQYNEAERLAERELNLRREGETFGEKHPDTMRSMVSLAKIYRDRLRYDEAESLHKQALDLQQKVLGKEHPDTIKTLAQLGEVYEMHARYDEAERLQKEALELRQKVLGEKHPDAIWTMVQLEKIYTAQGRYNEAERLQKQALYLHQEVLGEKHIDTAKILVSIGEIYQLQVRYDEAERLQKEALELRQKVLGEKHPGAIWTMVQLGKIYTAQGRYSEAERLQKQALYLHQEVLGEKHIDTAKILVSIGEIYQLQARYDEAERLQKEALEIQQKVLGERHLETTFTLVYLAKIYQVQGQRDKAREILMKLLDFQQETLGEMHIYPILRMAYLGLKYCTEDRYDKADEAILKFLSLIQGLLGEKHPITMYGMSVVAGAYYNCRYDESKELMIKLFELQREVFGENHPDTIKTMTKLAKYYNRDRGGEQTSGQDDEKEHPVPDDAGESGLNDKQQPGRDDDEQKEVMYVKTKTSKRRKL